MEDNSRYLCAETSEDRKRFVAAVLKNKVCCHTLVISIDVSSIVLTDHSTVCTVSITCHKHILYIHTLTYLTIHVFLVLSHMVSSHQYPNDGIQTPIMPIRTVPCDIDARNRGFSVLVCNHNMHTQSIISRMCSSRGTLKCTQLHI